MPAFQSSSTIVKLNRDTFVMPTIRAQLSSAQLYSSLLCALKAKSHNNTRPNLPTHYLLTAMQEINSFINKCD